MNMDPRTQPAIVREVANNRNMAMKAKSRTDFFEEVTRAEDYLRGDQIPDTFPTDTHMYLVANLVPDLVERLASLIGGGRLSTVIDSDDEIDPNLLRIARAQDMLWQKKANFKPLVHEQIRDMVSFGLGVLRVFVDPTRMTKYGGFIGIQHVHPLEIWLSPYAHDPFRQLLGSDYIGHETTIKRRDLLAMYPDKALDIMSLPATAGASRATATKDDPASISTRGAESSVSGDTATPTAGPVQTPDATRAPSAQLYDNIRFIRYEYRVTSTTETYGIKVPTDHWYAVEMAGEIGSAGNASQLVVLRDPHKLPYGMPTYVCMSNSVRNDGPYSSGIMGRIRGLQDFLNVMLSVMAKTTMDASKLGGKVFYDSSIFDQETRAALNTGNSAQWIGTDASPGLDKPNLKEGIHRLDMQPTKFAEFDHLMNRTVQFMRETASVSEAITGNVDLSKRVSGRAIGAMQQASLGAQESARLQVETAVSYLARLGAVARQIHWTTSHRMSDVGTDKTFMMNARVPANPASMDAARGMQGGNSNTPSGPLVPTGFSAIGPDGEETKVPFDDQAEIERLESTDGLMSKDIMFNDLSTIDLDVSVSVQADYEARQQFISEGLAQIINAKGPESVSAKTLWNTYFGNVPGMSFTNEQESLMGEQMARILAEIEKGGPEKQQQAMQVLAQVMQPEQQPQPTDGNAPGAQAGSQPTPGAPGL